MANNKNNKTSRSKQKSATRENDETEEILTLPIILKADVQGSLDAIEHELEKIPQEDVQIKIVQKGVGIITENDVKMAAGKTDAVVLGFHTTIDASAQDLALRLNITTEIFDIIYNLSEWVLKEVQKRTPEKRIENINGKARVLQTFSITKQRQVLGGTVLDGLITVGDKIKIIRKEEEIGEGMVINLQQQKADAKKITMGNEFGAQVDAKIEIEKGDILESIAIKIV